MARLTYNNLIIAGNVVSNAKLMKKDNSSVATTSIAINELISSSGEEKKERTTYVDVVAFGRVAESLARLEKGDNAFIEGKLATDVWEKDGEKRSKLRMVAFMVRILSKASRQTGEAPTNAVETANSPVSDETIEDESPFLA